MVEDSDTPGTELNLTLSAREWRELQKKQRLEWKGYQEQVRRDNELWRAQFRNDDLLGGLLPALREPGWLRDIRTSLDKVGEGVERWLDETYEARERFAKKVNRFVMTDLPEMLRQAQGALAGRFSPNWRDLDAGELEEATALAMERGLCTVWSPRVEFIRELISAADDEELEARLLGREHEILEDVEATLGEATHPRLVELQDCAKEAVATYRNQGPRPAQAYATVLLTNIVNVTFGLKFKNALDRWQAQEPMEVPLGEFRFRLIFWSFGRALKHTNLAGPGFNRHAAVGHTTLSDQYTRANALAAILLLGAVVRELHWFFTALDEANKAEQAA
jgi:hypothetical protein